MALLDNQEFDGAIIDLNYTRDTNRQHRRSVRTVLHDEPGGSGIGLFLSRQIADVHAGPVRLKNRETGGCRTMIALPL